MSLSIALQQIQKPSWHPPAEEKRSIMRLTNKHYQERRDEIIKAVASSETPVSIKWVIEYTGYTRQAVQNTVDGLIKSGKLLRIGSGPGVTLEVIK